MSNSLTISPSTAIPTNSSITTLDLGQAANAGYITTGNLDFAGGSVTFSGIGTGLYQGSVGGTAADPFIGAGKDPNNYFAAEKNGSVTLNFAAPQEYFGLLWGSVDSFNTLTFYNASGAVVDTVTGPQVLAAGGITAGNQGAAGSVFVNIDIPGGYSKVVASSTSSAFELGSISYAAATIANPLAPGGSQVVIPDDSNGKPLCFLAGTGIATPSGRVPIEDLRAGDLVSTADGGAAPIRWIGVRAVSIRFADLLRMLPIRIAAGALADDIPHRDLLVSPDHALLVGGILIHAAAMVNGVTIRRETAMPDHFTYYHLELAGHALVLAEGAAAETFVDNVDRMAFDNWAEREARADDAIAEMDYPRAKAARQIPLAIKTSLEARMGKKAA